MNKKTLLTGGLAAMLTFGGLAGCGDGVDQDNGISDGEQKDQIDNDTKKEANDTFKEAKDNMEDAKNNVESQLKKEGIGNGVDQDNGISDSEKQDDVDNN
ncbi:hypothetical protein RCG19_08250 [Neobacillus sp. OS1-2]|uniref:hypothetical protein n=1 Tax=Neobacillus sp. OS1-2 TaxID=3070680 RepID=UPI0027DFDCAA|nr:hypothetical protein [Neobacillus sp. OS1-2]WML41628.1 hypothetical protein RCG19_08250 [Neobacillus sp. OS1-2]